MKNKGLSLLETVLAMALGAMILLPMARSVNIALKNWDEDTKYSELYQHARLAMQRITSELRYATRVIDWEISPNVLKFYTRTLIDDDYAAEIIEYDGTPGTFITPPILGLKRSQDGDTMQVVAGSDKEPKINVSNFEVKHFKVSGTDLVELQPGDKDDLSEAVLISLTVGTDGGQKSVTLKSLVKLRNR